VPPRNAAALAAAISRVLTEPGTARLAAAARQTAQRYTWPVLARQIAAAYLEVTGKGRPA
jgi:glycosyltransferase involved in cell wall biosynthesis